MKHKKKRKSSSVIKTFMGFINGNALAKEEVVMHLPFMMFFVLIALVYIVNGYWAENTVRSINKATNSLKEMRSEYITTKSDLMYICKQSEIAAIISKKGLGLKESYTPPKKIVVDRQKEAENN